MGDVEAYVFHVLVGCHGSEAGPTLTTFLITGGGGFIGSWVALALLEQEHEVVILDTERRVSLLGDAARRVKFEKANISSPEVGRILKKVRPDTVIHYAALLSAAAESDPELGYRTNIASTWPLFEAARAADVGSVLFASSNAAYGPDAGEVAEERTYSIPSTIYGISKIFGELAGVWFSRKYGMGFAAFRYASVIGPGRRNGGASAYTTLLIQRPAQGDPYNVDVRRSARTPLVYVKDAVRATLMVGENIKRLRHSVFNVCGLSPTPNAGEIADCVARRVPHAKIKFAPKPEVVEIVDSWAKEASSERLLSLGWKPEFSQLDPLVSDFVREIRENPKMYAI